MRREFGGCAGNIAYNLRMLGGSPLIMATVGDDYQPYAYRLERLKLSQAHVRQVKDTFTAQAFITTDLDDNQITAFHPGAMNHSHLNHVSDAKDVSLGIVAPDGREGMQNHAREFAEAGIPFIFDPGQGMPMFNGEELLEFVRWPSYVAVNDYEARLLQEKTGRSIEQLAAMVKALIVTEGADGSLIYVDGNTLRIPSVKADRRARSDRLRRCLSCRTAVWHRAGLRLAHHRAARLAHGLDQDRQPRRAEPCRDAR